MKKKIFGVGFFLVLDAIFSFPLALLLDAFLRSLAGSQALLIPRFPGSLGELRALIGAPNILRLWLPMQILVILFLVYQFWRPDRQHLAYEATDALGGPPAAGRGEHGTARWRSKAELQSTLTLIDASKISPPDKRGGIVVGAVPKKYDMRVYLDTDDAHTLLLGATRSGKSRSIIFPSIWTIGKIGRLAKLDDWQNR